MTVQIEHLTVAFDGISLQVQVDGRVAVRDGRGLHTGERARVYLADVIVRHTQPLELVYAGEHTRRQILYFVVGQIQYAQVHVLVEVLLAERQLVARQVQVLNKNSKDNFFLTNLEKFFSLNEPTQ